MLYNFNCMYIKENIGGVELILVKTTPNYRRRQGIIMHNTMIPKHCNKNRSSNLLGVVLIFISIYMMIYNFKLMYIWGIGGVKSIFVQKMPNYRRRQGIVMHITMIPKHL